MMSRLAFSLTLWRHAAGFAARPAAARGGRRALSAAVEEPAAASAARVAVGEVVVREPGVAVVRDASGLGGTEVVAGRRVAVGDAEGTVVLTRSPLFVVCLDDDDAGGDGGDAATLALRRMAARAGDAAAAADAFALDAPLEAAGDARALAGRCVDAAGAALDGGAAPARGSAARPVFAEGLAQAEMAPIDAFLTSGVPAVDAMVPWGKGQSVLVVGDLASRDACRTLARTAAAAGGATTTIYAALDGGRDGAASVRAAVPENAGVVVARPRASAFASECEAVLCAHAALSYGDAVRAAGGDALVVLDGLEPLVDLWRRSTRVAADAFGAANAALGDDSECRRFLGEVLQRAGNAKGGGSLSVVALVGDEGPDASAAEPAPATFSAADFRAAGARASILARLDALEARGVALTDAVLAKIGVAAPGRARARGAPGGKRRAEAVELLTSIADAHVDVAAAPGGGFDVDASASLQRVGVGADVGTDTRPAALKTLGVGNRLRLELAAATDAEEAGGDLAVAQADAASRVRAAAWRAALRVRADDPPRPLSATCALSTAVQLGLFDGVEEPAAAAARVDAVLAAAPPTDVDATSALSPEDRGALKVAATLALQDF